MKCMYTDEVNNECEQIINIASKYLPKYLDGKEAIKELRKEDYNWRQVEWIGFYFEHKLFNLLTEHLGGNYGPRYKKNVTFDYKRNFVWDFKAHPLLRKDNSKNYLSILNDKEAIENCIRDYSGIGFIVINGFAEYEKNGEFKEWHDLLKGEISDYEKNRIERRANPRLRKTAFKIERIESYFFRNRNDLDIAMSEGWLTVFNQGRKSNSKSRPPKYALRVR